MREVLPGTGESSWERERLLESLEAYRRGLSDAPLLRKWNGGGLAAALSALGLDGGMESAGNRFGLAGGLGGRAAAAGMESAAGNRFGLAGGIGGPAAGWPDLAGGRLGADSGDRGAAGNRLGWAGGLGGPAAGGPESAAGGLARTARTPARRR